MFNDQNSTSRGNYSTGLTNPTEQSLMLHNTVDQYAIMSQNTSGLMFCHSDNDHFERSEINDPLLLAVIDSTGR